MIKPKIILASASPRRKAILSQIGMEFSTEISHINEDFDIELPPEAFCEHWAREKAKCISLKRPNRYIIGADTIVYHDGKILGKPFDYNDGVSMLRSLSGKTHEVLTGISIINKELDQDFTFHETTYVSVQNLDNDMIHKYLKTYNPLDKAGSYGIQDGFSIHIEKIEGCFYNVMGFPVSKFYKFLKNTLNKSILID